jgi:uncharacterized phage protein (TIGR02220 family)
MEQRIKDLEDRVKTLETYLFADRPKPFIEIVDNPRLTAKDFVEEVIEALNHYGNKHFRPHNSKTRDFIHARLREDATLTKQDFIDVVKFMCAKWKNTEMEGYLRPETLFNATKFESYLGEMRGAKSKQGSYDELFGG